jgi:hypothetical protein
MKNEAANLKENVMRLMLVALAGLGLMLSASAPAYAVVCAAGVHHAGCVATPRAGAVVVAPRAAVAHPVARGAAVVRHPVVHPRVVR